MTKTLMKGCEYLLRTTTAGELFTPEDFSDEQRQIADTTEQFIKKTCCRLSRRSTSRILTLWSISCARAPNSVC